MSKTYVIMAAPYNPMAMQSIGRANLMFWRQCNFPHQYDEKLDKLIHEDHDRIMDREYSHFQACLARYVHSGELALASWFLEADDTRVFNFLKSVMRADEKVEWNGYRILGSIHLGDGAPVWRLELFAKSLKSQTAVYTGDQAPNIAKKRK